MADAAEAGSPLLNLPSELLHHVLILLSPSDLSALCQTCRTLGSHIVASDHLWMQIYHERWDTPRLATLDPLLTQPCPRTRLFWSKGKEVEQQAASASLGRERKLYLDLSVFDHSDLFHFAKQVQRRTWAEKKIAKLQSRPIDVVSNYNDTLRSLLSIARSRRFRRPDDSGRSKNGQYLIDLLTAPNSSENFRKLVYPRTDVSRLREWQLCTLVEKSARGAGAQVSLNKGGSEKRNRSVSLSSSVREEKRRKASDGSSTRKRRRSTRLLLNAYPPELHHLLYDRDGNNLIDLDDGQGAVCLEELELLDEQLAAELHVLHGRELGSKQPTESGNEAGQEGSSAIEDEEEQADNFQHNHHHHHHHYLPEHILGGECGYEGDARLRGRAREIVYDTANYGPENSYGPLRAWRERWETIDGRRPEHRAMGEDGEDRALEGEETEEAQAETQSESEESNSSSTPGDVDDVPIVDLTDETVLSLHHHDLHDAGWAGDSDDSDDDDFASDGGEEDEEEMLLVEVREMAIALSHGLYPYHESRRLKRAIVEHNCKTGRQRRRAVPLATVDGSPGTTTAGVCHVWRMEKRIDWVIVEAIMTVMYCNIRHAVVNHGWGRSFRLPGSSRSLTGKDAEARRLYSNQPSGGFYLEWCNILCMPCGWNHSRGDEARIPPLPDNGDKRGDEKPFDYAGVESTWIGTYAFLDWSKWAAFNARDPLSRGLSESSYPSDPTKPLPLGNTTSTMPSLRNEREAVGDCLQLRLELLPNSEQHAASFREEAVDELEGESSARYPPLRFRGHTLTYDEDLPTPRGQVHGLVRPVFAPAHEKYYNQDEGEEERAIVGLHWDLVHRYEGEDRWSLSGIQPGPPGSRAPIYGIWGSSQRSDDLSPCGPFTYFLVDDRPWKELDELLEQERRGVGRQR